MQVLRREKTRVEGPAVQWARRNGVVAIPLKLLPGGETGLPDCIFLFDGGRTVFIEFKDPNGHLSPKQVYWKLKLKKMGHKVYACFSAQEAIEKLAKVLGATRLSGARREVASTKKRRRAVS